jgi:CPA2 family monovalent cation:H+ antiporter-2
MEHGYLNDILVLFTAAVAVVVAFLHFRLPAILGYLAAGVLMGPYGFGFIASTENTRAFAEFGVVFLLFTVGLEFSLPLLKRMKGAVLGLGAFQVLLTTVIIAAVSFYLGMSPEAAVVLGGVVAMSSTALVTKQLTEQVELHSRHGRNAVGILLFQDLMVVPFLIFVSNLAKPSSSTSTLGILMALGEGVLALLLIYILGRWVLRPIFRFVARFHSTELFTLTVLLVTLASAWLTNIFGLSLALGAFIAGMMLGETEFRHQVEAEIRPFRDVLLGLFFITIGMLLDISVLPEIWSWALLLLVSIVGMKLLLVMGLCRIAGWDMAVALRTGLVMAHGGEFGFAILAVALNINLFPPDYSQVILASLLISMGLAPLLIRFNSQITCKVLPSANSASRQNLKKQISETAHNVSGHVIICGYGRVGQNIARFLCDESIPYVAMDLDPVLVQNAIKAKEPVTYGDAGNIELLLAAGLSRAAALVISLDDIEATEKILTKVRQRNKEIPILVRTTDDSDLEHLQNAGATEVVPETMESSLMLSAHLLVMLKVPINHVLHKINTVRKNRYSMLRRLFPGEEDPFETPGEASEQLRAVELDHSHAIADLSLSELGLGSEVVVVAIKRDGKELMNPTGQTRLMVGDTLLLSGQPEALEKAEAKLVAKL